MKTRLITHPVPVAHALGAFAGSVVVAIDVLRASTTLCAALAAGAAPVFAVESIAQARALAQRMQPRPLLAGETQCLRPEGFDLGNSPLEMTPAAVAGRAIVASTTNGTRALAAGAGAELLLLTAFVNLSATVDHIAAAGPRTVHLVCAGADGKLAQDDVAFAGALARALLDLLPDLAPDASTREALTVAPANLSPSTVLATLLNSGPGQRLVGLGMEADVRFAARVDALPFAVRGRPTPHGVELAVTRL